MLFGAFATAMASKAPSFFCTCPRSGSTCVNAWAAALDVFQLQWPLSVGTRALVQGLSNSQQPGVFEALLCLRPLVTIASLPYDCDPLCPLAMPAGWIEQGHLDGCGTPEAPLLHQTAQPWSRLSVAECSVPLMARLLLIRCTACV